MNKAFEKILERLILESSSCKVYKLINPNYKEDFERAEDYLQREYPSADIINPALVNSFLPKSTTHEEYMRMSFCMLDMCDSIYMLSNYENSKGACMEYCYALAKDMIIMYE